MQPAVRTVDRAHRGGSPRARRASRRRLLICAAAGIVFLAGCGLRVSKQDVRAANQAALGSGSGGGVGNVAGGNGGSGTNGGTGSNGVGSNASSSGGATGNGPGGVNGLTSGGGSGANLAGGAGSNTSGAGGVTGSCAGVGNTDVGVTATSINVGNVSDLGGPVPGLFQGGPYGTQAYFDYINSQGGICGRKLHLTTADDQLQCSQNEADYQNLVGQVFAFVGSWSLDDSCGAQILAQHPTVPAVQQALSIQFTNLPNSYSISPYNAGAPTGYFQYFKAKYPDAITKVGTIVGNQPAAVQSWNYYKATMQSLGYNVIYEDEFPPAQSNFTADVIRMRSQGVKMVFIIAVNAPDLADFSQEAAQQGFKPEVFVGPIGYFGSYIAESGGPANVEGQYVPLTQAMFLGEDAPTVPEVATFDHWIKQQFPNFAIDQFSATSWAQAALFVQALKMVGGKLTRQAVLQALSQIHQFNDYGMATPTDIAAKASSTCYLLLQIHNGHYVKVDDPPAGFRCDGTFHKV